MFLVIQSGASSRLDFALVFGAEIKAEFWVVNVFDGQIIAQCQQRHRHDEWLRFLRQIDHETPKGKTLHLICDNYATHKPPNVQEWLKKHPRFNMHFTPIWPSGGEATI